METMEARMWYVAVAGQQQGPMGMEDLINEIRSGHFTGDTLGYAEGVTVNWTPLSNIPCFASALKGEKAPPPIPVERTFGKPRADEIDYEIFGEDMQFVEITLDPEETVVAESGAMMYMDSAIRMQAHFGDASGREGTDLLGKLVTAGKRLLAGESLFMTTFTAAGSHRSKVAFAAPYPGKIIPIDLRQTGGSLICQKDSFLCAARGVAISIAFNKKLGVGLFGGEGFIMEKIEGDGLAFVHAGGTIVSRELAPAEQIKIDTGCIVAFESSVSYDIQLVSEIKTALFGGEGLFLATLTGPGRIYLQSLPFSRMADRIISAAPRAGGSRKEEGSLLGGLGSFLGGDR